MKDFVEMLKYGFFIVGGIIFVVSIQLIALMMEGRFNLILQIYK